MQNLKSLEFIFINLLILLISIIISLVIIIIIIILTKKKKTNRELLSAFECGFDSANRGLLPFSLRFYLLANIFLIFDVELILLFPFLVKTIWVASWISLAIFRGLLIILSLGLFYEWNQKMLEWVV